MDVLVQILINTIFTGGGYVLLSLGFNLFYKTRKFIDVSYGSLIVIGGYAMLLFHNQLSLNFYLSLALAILATVAAALILDVAVYRKLTDKKTNSLIPLVASLGVYTAITAIISLFFTSQYQALYRGPAQIFTIWGGNISLVNIIFIVASVVLSLLVLYILYRTRFGRGIRAVDDDVEVAEISGIPTRKITLQSIALGAALAGLVGILIGYDIGILPVLGLPYLLRSFIITVMGGLGSIPGGIISAFILSATENLTAYFLSTAWKEPMVFLIFLIVLLVRPNGIFQRPQK
jgi:branched-chain amino acid transport system permease protein